MVGAFEDGEGEGAEVRGKDGGGEGSGGFVLGEDGCTGLDGGVEFETDEVAGDFVVGDLPGEDFLAGVAAFGITDPGIEVGFVGGVIFGEFVAGGGEAGFDAVDFVGFGGEGGEARGLEMFKEGGPRRGDEPVADANEAGLAQRADRVPREGSEGGCFEGGGFEALLSEPCARAFTFQIEDQVGCAGIGEGDVVVEEDAAAEVGVGGGGVKGDKMDGFVFFKELKHVEDARGGAGEDGGDGGICGAGEGVNVVGGLALEEGEAVGASEAEEPAVGEVVREGREGHGLIISGRGDGNF